MIRETLFNSALSLVVSFGEMVGLRRTVELSDHSIEISLELPDKTNRAWDPNLYKRGNVFIKGYANPVKPSVTSNPELKKPDTVGIEEGDPDTDTEEDTEESKRSNVELIASPRYQSFMRQDLISQLLNPQSQWQILVYAVIGVAVIGFLNIIITLWATGSFA